MQLTSDEMINLKEGDTLVAAARLVVEEDEEGGEGVEGAVENADAGGEGAVEQSEPEIE